MQKLILISFLSMLSLNCIFGQKTQELSISLSNGKEIPYALVKEPKNKTQNLPLLIGLHGFGIDENQIKTLINPELPFECYYVAPRGFVELGKNEYAWFDIQIENGKPIFKNEDFETCLTQLSELIDKLIVKYPINPENIFLIGYSQGATVAYSAALVLKQITGIVAFAGSLFYIPQKPLQNKIPFFMGYGTLDSFISPEDMQKSKERLEVNGLKVQYKEYQIPHVVSESEREDLVKWLVANLK